MKIPEKFTINSQEIKIELVDRLSDQDFGEFNCITNVIKIAECVEDDNKNLIKLKDEQILNTLIHEILHAYQWYSSGEYNEAQSNTYAGYFVEFLKSTKLIEKL